MCDFLSSEVQFGLGAGRDGCPLHTANQGTDSKMCTEGAMWNGRICGNTLWRTSDGPRELDVMFYLLSQASEQTVLALCFIADLLYSVVQFSTVDPIERL